MALLSPEERKKIQEQTGNYVTEACDVCHKPIFDYVRYILKSGQVVCSKCKTGQRFEVDTKKTKEENEEMATAKKAVKKEATEKTSKVAGHLLAGTAIADLYLFLKDEKRHSLKDTLKAISKHKADKMGRLRQLARYGKKFGTWAVVIDDEAETVQLKLGKGAAKEAAKPVKKEPAAKKAAGKKVEDKEDESKGSDKKLAAIQKLIRRTIKDGKDLTRSKVIEQVSEEHELEPRQVQEALNTEIKLGGIEVDKGILRLV
jgi:hypothetical protein